MWIGQNSMVKASADGWNIWKYFNKQVVAKFW